MDFSFSPLKFYFDFHSYKLETFFFILHIDCRNWIELKSKCYL